MDKVIFACVHNAGRSQMAAAFFNKFADPSKATAISAGTEPASKVHPEVLEVMKEVGIDLSNAYPTLLTQELASNVQLLVTMGCGEKCPYVPGLQIKDWLLEDPKGKSIEQVRSTRDKIKLLIQDLIKDRKW
ncbi:low molecular weight phosphatase family protein [Bdellovibrio sp. qaytius]|nr:low molecular weight phosphatase family protein [Bdellovibrio sp. qaytius]